MDEGGEEAADGAPLDRDGHHAVHDEEDEELVPHHDVAVELQLALLRAEAVEDAAWNRRKEIDCAKYQSFQIKEGIEYARRKSSFR